MTFYPSVLSNRQLMGHMVDSESVPRGAEPKSTSQNERKRKKKKSTSKQTVKNENGHYDV